MLSHNGMMCSAHHEEGYFGPQHIHTHTHTHVYIYVHNNNTFYDREERYDISVASSPSASFATCLETMRIMIDDV